MSCNGPGYEYMDGQRIVGVGQICTEKLLHQGSSLHKGTLLHKGSLLHKGFFFAWEWLNRKNKKTKKYIDKKTKNKVNKLPNKSKD